MTSAPAPPLAPRVLTRVVAAGLTLAVLAFIFSRVPLDRLVLALRDADFVRFLSIMVPNGVIFFAWDTFVLATAIRWFHGPVRYRDLLPARAVSYVVALFNSNLARGALAGYLSRTLGERLLPLGSTVIFLVLTEYTHLFAWGALGLLLAGDQVPRDLVWVPPAVAAFWLVLVGYMRYGLRPWELVRRSSRVASREAAHDPRNWALLRTFRVATPARYVQTILLRAPLFFLSLVFHYFAAPAFGIHIPFLQLMTFLPVIFMAAALPITVAHLGTTQAAWIFFFSAYATPAELLAFSLCAHLTFTATRAAIGLVFTPMAYDAVIRPRARPAAIAGHGRQTV